MGVKEAWLKSKDHEQRADAMVACQSHAPWECGHTGACQFGGSCFTTERQAASVAWRMIGRLHSENPMVEAALRRAEDFLRYGELPVNRE